MKILALESSGMVASVAVVTDEAVLSEYTINHKKTHSQTLLPMLDEVVKMLELDLSEIDAIAVSKGPGSFTGLRIGSATAKGLGLALNKPLVAVETLDAMAYQLYGTTDVICPMMDARRNQVYSGLYEFENQKFSVISAQMAADVMEMIHKVNELGRPVIYLGDGASVYYDTICNYTTVPYSFAKQYQNRQRAAVLGCLAAEYFKEGRTETAMEHKPDYLRLSQAERERKEASEKK